MRVLPTITQTTLGLLLLAGFFTSGMAISAPTCIKPTLDAIGEGRRAYVRLNCYNCHGNNAKGGIMAPSIAGEDDVGEAVTKGEDEGMPSFKNDLCPGDIKNLAAYLRAAGETTTAPTFMHWWEANPTR